MVVHISRQQGQSLLHVRQQFRLKAGADFLQRVINRVISSDRIRPFNPSRYSLAISPRTPASVSRAILLRGGSTSAFLLVRQCYVPGSLG